MKKTILNPIVAILSAVLTLGAACSQPSSVSTPNQPKLHAYLKIPGELIAQHVKGGGKRIVLEFREQKDSVVLEFIGFGGNDTITKRQILPTVDKKANPLQNIYFGQFRNDEANMSINAIVTSGTPKDWYLRPRNYSGQGKYVCYDLSDQPFPGTGADTTASSTKLASRINPSPPCCM